MLQSGNRQKQSVILGYDRSLGVKSPSTLFMKIIRFTLDMLCTELRLINLEEIALQL